MLLASVPLLFRVWIVVEILLERVGDETECDKSILVVNIALYSNNFLVGLDSDGFAVSLVLRILCLFSVLLIGEIAHSVVDDLVHGETIFTQN